MAKLSKKKTLYIFVAALVLITSAAFFYRHQKVALEKRRLAWDNLTKILGEKIEAARLDAGLVIEDLLMRSMIVHAADKPFASASLVKVPIMLACFYAAEKKRIDLRDVLTLKPAQKVLGSGMLKELPAGTRFTVEELIGFMVSHSDNIACNMLIDYLGFDYINEFFRNLGLKNTNLSRKMMAFAARKKGIENYTTARDMAFCLEIIYYNKFISRKVSQQCLSLLKKQEVNDRIPARLPPSVAVAHKTGLERKICHDAGIIFTPGGDFLVCVLTKNAKSTKAAKKFIAQIALDVYEYAGNFH